MKRLVLLLLLFALCAPSVLATDRNYNITFSTYKGGTGEDEDHGDVAIDSSGNVYVVGFSDGSFPNMDNSYQGGAMDAVACKYNKSGTRQWCLYYGSANATNGYDYFLSASIDPTETYLYAAGRCGTSITMTGGTIGTSFAGYDNGSYGQTNGCIYAIDLTDGSDDIKTYWGTSSSVRQLNWCPDGDIVVAQGYDPQNGQSAYTASWSTGRYMASAPGGGSNRDLYVCKISADLTTIRWCTYYGGNGDDNLDGHAACNASNEVFISACTASTNMDVDPAGYDTSYSANYDGWVGKLKSDGTDLLWGTYHGDAAFDCPGSKNGLQTAANGIDVVVASGSQSTNFQTTTGAYDETWNTGNDLHLAVIGGTDGSLKSATWYGGSGTDGTEGLKVCADGTIVVAGDTTSSSLPTTINTYDSTYNGSSEKDGYIVALDAGLRDLLFATYMGSSNVEMLRGIACGPEGEIAAAGRSEGSGFPAVSADQSSFGGGSADFIFTRYSQAIRTMQ